MAVGDALELVGTINGTGSSATLSFTGIDADSSMSWIVRGMFSSAGTNPAMLRVRMNNDSNARYEYSYIQSYEGGTVSQSVGNAETYAQIAYGPGTSYNVGYARSAINAEFYNLSDSSTSPGSPSFLCHYGGMGNGNTGTVLGLYSGSYSYKHGAPTGTDVTSLDFFLADGSNFPATTVFSLYKRPTS
jgi:hypothetical protein|tara:strand:+ start:198 stop:761 length:564 start_codon:yes stop_codon:yes gene_type:complete